VTTGREEYDLEPYFYAALGSVESVRFRQEVFADLDGQPVASDVRAFADRMRRVRHPLAVAHRLRHALQAQAWFVDAVAEYCAAVRQLAGDLARADLASQGLSGLRDHLGRYVGSGPFTVLSAGAAQVKAGLAGVRYCLDIRGGRVRVTRYDGEVDYTEQVQETFHRFRQGAVKSHLLDLGNQVEINHVEARVLAFVARLYPQEFTALGEFCAGHSDFLDPTVAGFDRQVQFYLAYLDFIAPLRAAGLSLCYPDVSRSKQIHVEAGVDIALADRLVRLGEPVVGNDFHLAGAERVFVVTGPNQGGKTTFARAAGQLHYLAALGCPVPARRARLFLFDRMFTHFDREEDVSGLSHFRAR
jgi:hypothetical protein